LKISLSPPGITDQINQKIAEQKTTNDASLNSILKQLTDSAASLLGQQDPAKVEQLQGTFNNVLTQTNALQSSLNQQGTAIQASIVDALGKLYSNTLESANKIAADLDAGRQ
jgi:hypothetical protein